MELERLRATTVVQAKIEKESSQQKADAELYAQEKAAEGKKYGDQADAEAKAFRRMRDAEADYAAKEREAEANFLVTKRTAEAEYFRKERDAQAQLITQQREAEGLSAMAKAYGDLANVLGGPAGLVRFLSLIPYLSNIRANKTTDAIPHADKRYIRTSCRRQRPRYQGPATQNQRLEHGCFGWRAGFYGAY
jgi:flotillin